MDRPPFFFMATTWEADAMNAMTGTQRAMFYNIVLLISRLLLAWIFLHEGASLVANFAPASASMAKVGIPYCSSSLR
jgi:uncharacterized membrane protein YphA (DoxX/SURF4 family)